MSFAKFLNGYYDVEGQLSKYMYNKAVTFFDSEQKVRAEISSVEAFEAYSKYKREQFIEAIGGLDFEKAPLNAECAGTLCRHDYRIEKIIFQSLKDFFVTANLYIPENISGKAPAILFACGHGREAKGHDTYQKVCIDLAKNGFVVLAVDPVGQGERLQYYDAELKRSLVTWGVIEHSYTGLQCDLTGSSIARYFINDLMKAVDFLYTLEYVDTERIGMTGASGGGTQTAYMMMVDDRIRAAAPCNYITSREDYMKTGQSHDSEQNIFGSIANGIDNSNYVLAFAPKPVLIGSVESDFFCIEGALKAYQDAYKIYSLYEYEQQVQHYIAKGTHAYNDELRQAVVNWFLKQFMGKKEDSFITNANMTIENPKELYCTLNGQVMSDCKNARSLYDLNLQYYSENKYNDNQQLVEIKNSMIEFLNLPKDNSFIRCRTIGSDIKEGHKYSKKFFFSERDIIVSGVYIEKEGRNAKKCYITVLENGTESIRYEEDMLGVLLKEGDVFVIDPRGIGACRSRCINSHDYKAPYGTEYKFNSDAIMLKTSICAFRTFDVLRACDYVRQENPGIETNIAGKGLNSIYSLFASLADDKTKELYLENPISSFEEIVTTKYYKYDPRIDIYGVLKKFDIPLIIRELAKYKHITCIKTPEVGINVKL